MKKLIAALAVLSCLSLAALTFARFKNSENPLIPRTILFGNPRNGGFQLSPDGKQLLFLAPLNPADEKSIMNIWIRKTDLSDKPEQLTHFTDRSLTGAFWSYNGSEIFFARDNNGDENWQLFSVNRATKKVECITPFEKISIGFLSHFDKKSPLILLKINKDNPAVHDIYSFNCDTRELKMICKNPGTIVQWLADRNGNIRVGLRQNEDGSQEIMYKDINSSTWQAVRTYDKEMSGMADCGLVGFSALHKCFYFTESKESDTMQLMRYDLKTKKSSLIANNPSYDITDASINDTTEEVESYSFSGEKFTTCFLKDGMYKTIFERINKEHTGNISIVGKDDTNTVWLIFVGKDNAGSIYYLYNKDTDVLKELCRTRPELESYHLSSVEPISLKSRDGLTLHGYITYPYGSSRTNLPLVLKVHGGPWSRDEWGFSASTQLLANRGYAVLQINFRGSTGYGKKFLQASEKEWGAKMHDDLIDAVQWAINNKIADPKRIAIMGASYGGYAALCGATFTPDTFKCAVDIVGPSNLITLAHSFPPYWKAFMVKFHKNVGNPETEADFLKSRSPLFKVDAIKIPLLIAQGAKDPRVPQQESDQIVAALKERSLEHEYLLFADEGHGCVNAHNNLKLYARIEAFLAKHLGGRVEPE